MTGVPYGKMRWATEHSAPDGAWGTASRAIYKHSVPTELFPSTPGYIFSKRAHSKTHRRYF